MTENTTRKDYDFTGLPAKRVFANFLRWKVMSFGHLAGGPGLLWLATIWLRHRFGYWLAWFKIKHHKLFNRFVGVLGRIKRLILRR